MPPAQRDLRAGRIMLRQIDELARSGAEFMFETTLTTLSYALRIPRWRAGGHHVSLVYLRLPDADASVSRVRRRVAAGGHDVPEAVIRRRFARSLDCLEHRYKPLVDEWYVYDSIDNEFRPAERWDEP
jgi:predicted ABC-type ATPase